MFYVLCRLLILVSIDLGCLADIFYFMFCLHTSAGLLLNKMYITEHCWEVNNTIMIKCVVHRCTYMIFFNYLELVYKVLYLKKYMILVSVK